MRLSSVAVCVNETHPSRLTELVGLPDFAGGGVETREPAVGFVGSGVDADRVAVGGGSAGGLDFVAADHDLAGDVPREVVRVAAPVEYVIGLLGDRQRRIEAGVDEDVGFGLVGRDEFVEQKLPVRQRDVFQPGDVVFILGVRLECFTEVCCGLATEFEQALPFTLDRAAFHQHDFVVALERDEPAGFVELE